MLLEPRSVVVKATSLLDVPVLGGASAAIETSLLGEAL